METKIHNNRWDRFRRRWSSLNWSSPLSLFPHGWSGSIVVLLGSFFLCQALFIGPNVPYGYDITGPQPRLLFNLFVGACFFNGCAGLLLTKKAPRAVRFPFYLGGATQISLSWFAFRFALESSRHYTVLGRLLDQGFGILLAVVNLLFIISTILPDENRTPIVLKLPILIGALSFSLTCFYPFQMAWFGDEWFSCVLDQYPYQRAGFVSYVYVPTLFAIATIFFVLTLFLRKIIDVKATSVVIFCLILPVLVATVLTQEVYISDVSTQKLLLLCTDSAKDIGWLDRMAELLDTSSLARTVLSTLGIALQEPPMY